MATASDMENQIRNIVDLPDEILRNIFKVVSTFCVPSHSDLSLVCKKFYEISCQTKFYEITAKMLLDDNSEDLLTNSLKQFNSVYLSDDYLISSERVDNRLVLLQKHMKPLKIVGEGIKTFCIDSFYDIEIDSNLTSLLKLLPNLERIWLEGSMHFKQDEPQTTLNLPKLEELGIQNVYVGDITIFNHLPNDVLRKIEVHYELSEFKPDLSQLFNNQRRRLQEIRVACNLFPFIDFNALNSVTKAKIISHEPTDNLEPIFHGLKSLENLNLELNGSYISSEQAKLFANFHYLQTISIDWVCINYVYMYSSCLDGLSSRSLKNLRINIEPFLIKTQTLKALSRNLPQLEHLELSSKLPIEIINTILGHFPNLKKLYFSTNHDRYVFQNNFKNESLNTLRIEAVYNGSWSNMSGDFPKLLAACKNLKCFETTFKLNVKDILAILTLESNLNTLRRMFATNLVATLNTFGENLNEFSCNAIFEDGITEDFVQKYLKHKFKKIEFLKKLDHFYDPEKFTLLLNNGFTF